MKSWALTGIRRLEIIDVPAPKIASPNDVLVKISAIGVCGSDIHYYLNGKIGDQVVQYPFVIGHECAGIVAEAGVGAPRVKPGDRVAVDPAISCMKCDQCKAGRFHTCRNLVFLGCPGQASGCLTEYIIIPQENCYPIKDGVSIHQAVIAEPLSVGVHAVNLAGNLLGARVGIFGAGPIGLSVLFAAGAHGAEKIYALDKLEYRLDFVKQIGEIETFNPDKIDIVSEIFGREPAGLDVVFDCCGDQAALNQAVKLLKPGGSLTIVGIPAEDKIYFNPHEMRRKEITVRNVRRQLNCVPAALDLIERLIFDPATMITHRFDFDSAPEAFETVTGYRDGVVKAVIDGLQ